MILGQNDFKLVWFVLFFVIVIMVINLQQKKIHFDLPARFILTYNMNMMSSNTSFLHVDINVLHKPNFVDQ